MKLFTWHLRNDIDLRHRWWHRFLLVTYALSTIYLFVSFLSNPDFKVFDYPQWKMASTIGERIGPDLKTLSQLIQFGERVDEINSSSYSLNIPESSTLFGGEFSTKVYCSKNILDYLPTIQNKTGVKSYSLGENKAISFEEFSSFITKTNDKCILIDSYTKYNNYDVETGKTYYLRPDKTLLMGKTLSEDYGFYKTSSFKSWLFFAGDLVFSVLLTLLFAYIISIIYHKVVLYIIFGKTK
jgi:hypothetical protein